MGEDAGGCWKISNPEDTFRRRGGGALLKEVKEKEVGKSPAPFSYAQNVGIINESQLLCLPHTGSCEDKTTEKRVQIAQSHQSGAKALPLYGYILCRGVEWRSLLAIT